MSVESVARLRSRVRIAASILAPALGAFALLVREVASAFERIYTDIGAELPFLTQRFLDLGGGWSFLVAVALGIAFSAAWVDGRARRILEAAEEARPGFDDLSRRYGASVRTWGITVSVIAGVTVIGTVAIGAAILYLPMIGLIAGGSGL